MNDNIDSVEIGGQLSHNITLFGRLLYRLGVDVNPGRTTDVIQALVHVDIGRKEDFYYTLRSLLVNRRDDIPLFDEAFQRFWRKPSDGGIELELGRLIQDRAKNDEPLVVPPAPHEQEEVALADEENDAEEDDEELQTVVEITRTYSAREALYQKDFGELNAEEMREIKRLMLQMVWNLGRRRTRRQRGGRGRVLDMRRSIRRSFRYGGEMLEWRHRVRKTKPRPLVIVADISGSMERYTKLLLHFLYSLAEGMEQRVEVFVFATRLTRITRQLRGRNVDRALKEVSDSVVDWSGGTRIGDALHTFNYEWGRRVLRGGAVVLLISDGWDRGDPEMLDAEMARLRRTCHRLVWLNPLLGSREYEPLTRGIQAALPHIDDFLPVHNLASLDDLALHLRQLDDAHNARRRPIRLRGAAFIGHPR
jgi:uncharacterized protein with von Willebrand factor type A (vWA) domain